MRNICYKVSLELLILHAGIYSLLYSFSDRINRICKKYIVSMKLSYIYLSLNITIFNILYYMNYLIPVSILSVQKDSDKKIHKCCYYYSCNAYLKQ